MGLAQLAGTDAEQRGESYGGSFGPMGSVSGPLRRWGSIGFGGDYQYGGQITHGDTVGGATGHDQFFIATNQNSHAFDVPVRLGLDLYTGDGDRPTERFAENINRAAAPAPPAAAAPVVHPTTVAGSLRLAVPDGRTHAPSGTLAAPTAPGRRGAACDGRDRHGAARRDRRPGRAASGAGAGAGRRADRHRAWCRGHRVGLPAGRRHHPWPGSADARHPGHRPDPPGHRPRRTAARPGGRR
ncbi:hypothetical protein ACRAWF_43490 [Streptomyces sp. L7]